MRSGGNCKNSKPENLACMKRFDQINVIPFIDIMLVLLAIVLTTATFISQGLIEVDLPEATSSQSLQESSQKNLEIIINAENKLYLSDRLIDSNGLSKVLQSLDKNTPIVLRVDKQVAFENFVEVIDLLKLNHLEKFSIVTIQGKRK